jgi:hypothetical protein
MIGNDELAIITVAWHFLDATVSKGSITTLKDGTNTKANNELALAA